MMIRVARIFRLVVVLLMVCVSWQAHAAEKGPTGVIRVGIFPFEPFNYMDSDGVPQGLNPDLLREIVKEQNWKIKFIPGNWAECLERLQKQEIDLMISVAYSPERALIMDYTYESVVELWGQVFVRPEGKSYNINDLEGLRVAIMRRDISGSNFIQTADKFGIQCKIIDLPTHADVFAAVQKNEADAGVAPQHFGLRHAQEYNLIGSTILFSPFSIYFASKKGTQHELLSHIDAHLSEWKRDKKSFYYQSLNRWMGNPSQARRIPVWLTYSLIAAVCSTLLFGGFVFLLKRTVKIKTQALQKSESALKEYRDHLEEIVEQRTQELKAMNRELEVFTYSVSHDLKAPLRGIDGYSRLLIKRHADGMDEEGSEFLQNICKSAAQMNQLIDDLLSYSRMERRNIQYGSVDITSLVDTLISQKAHDIEKHQIHVRINLPFTHVQTDIETLKQVLSNYLDNAIKFSKKEAPAQVEVGGRQDTDAWTLWVKDNGIGFDPKYCDRIFDIFQRLNRAEDFPGTGIGLAIVRKAIDRIGGRAWAESEEGKGSVFFITIPQKKAPDTTR